MKEYQISIYLLNENSALPREKRLTALAADYAARRGIAAADFRVERGENGKPFFPQQPRIHFSVSHSGEIWAAAFACAAVGLDIERQRRLDYAALARRKFSGDEYRLVLRQGSDAFFAIWCAKESIVKQSGEGMGGETRGFSVLHGETLATQCRGKALRHLRVAEGYFLAVCAEKIDAVEFNDFSAADLPNAWRR